MGILQSAGNRILFSVILISGSLSVVALYLFHPVLNGMPVENSHFADEAEAFDTESVAQIDEPAVQMDDVIAENDESTAQMDEPATSAISALDPPIYRIAGSTQRAPDGVVEDHAATDDHTTIDDHADPPAATESEEKDAELTAGLMPPPPVRDSGFVKDLEREAATGSMTEPAMEGAEPDPESKMPDREAEAPEAAEAALIEPPVEEPKDEAALLPVAEDETQAPAAAVETPVEDAEGVADQVQATEQAPPMIDRPPPGEIALVRIMVTDRFKRRIEDARFILVAAASDDPAEADGPHKAPSETPQPAFLGSDGYYLLEQLPEGLQEILVKAAGFSPRTLKAEVVPGETRTYWTILEK